MKEHKVYHIRDCGNTDLNHGYIGVTSHWDVRKSKHKYSGKLCKGREMVCLYTFTNKEEAYAKEAELRPTDGIGLNTVAGGLDSGKIVKGERRSVDTEFKKGQNPHNLNKGLHYILTSPEGDEFYVESLVAFCKAHNLTPQNLRKVAKGERNYHKGWKAILVSGR
ncbi:homing endonuclease [Vibrio phage VEN]|uniref:Homing endonuclease n=1 Tax=Vibrio phage VEN TaxID=2059879 RepID=A0A2H5BMX9_9CAUD|nr:homing endonuclease [Vibrio phage VEN]AUG87672.1 homing endonuclease [Vibrio phage VEN]